MSRFALAMLAVVCLSDAASAACGPLSRLRPRAVIQRNVERTRTVVTQRRVAPQFRVMYPLFVPMQQQGCPHCPKK